MRTDVDASSVWRFAKRSIMRMAAGGIRILHERPLPVFVVWVDFNDSAIQQIESLVAVEEIGRLIAAILSGQLQRAPHAFPGRNSS
jgi:hypothetical protein